MTRTRLAAAALLALTATACVFPAAAPEPPPAQTNYNTFSIVAYDPDTQQWGCAVASKVIAVGAAVPWARAGVGAVATQSYTNVTHGPNGLELMAKGMTAEEALKALQDSDKQIELRQLGLIDAKGGAASFTGKKCNAWAGHKVGKNYACQGNLLAGEAVVEDMAKAFEDTKGPFAWRLVAALEAAEKAGGDKRGKQSAALLVVKDKAGPNGFNDRMIDLRVDEHKEPVAELARILAMKMKRPVAKDAGAEVNTFSIVAYDPDKQEWGCAVASKYLGVGGVVPWGKAGAGMVATQAAVNIAHGPNGVELLAKGMSAEEVLKALQDADKNIEFRQLGIVDAKGNVVAFTGKKCSAWAGHKTGKNFACQGNILAGEAVIDDMAKAFEEAKGPLAWRMMAALEAADKAGGDKRGKQSAGILVVRDRYGPNGVGDRYIDLRVDDHKEPIPELARILSLRLKRP
jgi:uncharacterized Ntn-hydrolase superfamily protein